MSVVRFGASHNPAVTGPNSKQATCFDGSEIRLPSVYKEGWRPKTSAFLRSIASSGNDFERGRWRPDRGGTHLSSYSRPVILPACRTTVFFPPRLFALEVGLAVMRLWQMKTTSQISSLSFATTWAMATWGVTAQKRRHRISIGLLPKVKAVAGVRHGFRFSAPLAYDDQSEMIQGRESGHSRLWKSVT